jgi:adenylosuccinate synthase
LTVTVAIGAQFGDEGKGHIVDHLSSEADLTVRFQGGPNAGHTIRIGDRTVILHQLPAGILHSRCTAVCGPGMVIDPFGLTEEIREVREKGLFLGRLVLSERCHVILPHHRLQDAWEEGLRGKDALGTTGRGIGPAYMDRVGRMGVRLADLKRPEILGPKLELLYRAKPYLAGHPDLPPKERLLTDLLRVGNELSAHIQPTESLLWQAVARDDEVLLEGAQSTLLDIDFGTYPFLTSSHGTSAGALTGTGLPPQSVSEVLGVLKAYATRVGGGPFPTEAKGADGDRLREKGGERGATTGRPRRCGWLDLVLLRYAVHLNGMTQLAVTKVDVLGGEPQVPVAVAYHLPDGRESTLEPPALAEDLALVEPIWRFLPGWEEFTPTLRERIAREGHYALPRELRHFLSFVARETGVPVTRVGYGPSREETLELPLGVLESARSLAPWPGGSS